MHFVNVARATFKVLLDADGRNHVYSLTFSDRVLWLSVVEFGPNGNRKVADW